MKKFCSNIAFVLFLGLLLFSVYLNAGQEGKITNTSTTLNEAMNSAADWYTMAQVHISGESSDIVVATKWSGRILKGFYNPRRDSSIYIKCRTQQLDTCIISVPAESFTAKLPPMDIVFKTGTSDSAYYMFQKR